MKDLEKISYNYDFFNSLSLSDFDRNTLFSFLNDEEHFDSNFSLVYNYITSKKNLKNCLMQVENIEMDSNIKKNLKFRINSFH